MAVPRFNIEEASGGNPALRNMLRQLASSLSQQQQATATGNTPAPAQQAASVTFENPLFVVTFTAQQAATTQQAAQQASVGASAGAMIIYNQVRAATTRLFDAASNATLYGGDNGAAQSQFVITDLDPSLGWYFQVRSSYDGNTWNAWKTINGGKPVNAAVDSVSVQPAGDGLYAMFLLPGSTTAGIGVSAVGDGLPVAPGPGTAIENSVGIAAPGSFQDAGRHAIGLNASINEQGTVLCEWTDGATPWPATANCLVFGWGSQGQKPVISDITGGTFAVFMLSGGNLIAFGSGITADGGSFSLPPGFSNTNAMAIPSAASVQTANGNTAHGVANASITPKAGSQTEMAVAFKWGDGDSVSEGATWSADAQWFCIAWSPALQSHVQAVTGGQFLIIETPSGKLAFGTGTCASGATIPLPAGFAWQDSAGGVTAIGFCTPVSTTGSGGNDLHGIQLCAVNAAGQTILVYADGSGNEWTGSIAWAAIAWQT
jgi:hypothetical protein